MFYNSADPTERDTWATKEKLFKKHRPMNCGK